MLTAALCTLSMRHCTTFRAGSTLFTRPNLTSWNSVWSIASKRGVIQQRVYQSQLYNINELKYAYSVALQSIIDNLTVQLPSRIGIFKHVWGI